MALRRKGRSPAFFSHEFFIQNHVDIMSVLIACFLLAFMFETTANGALMFLTVQHNITILPEEEGEEPVTVYEYGVRDCATVFFYTTVAIVLHGMVQEHILDRINRRLHLSKAKHGKFNESGQLVIFFLLLFLGGVYILSFEEFTTQPSSLWEGYPHNTMSGSVKFFFICQLAYWVHALPELHFQKTKKEDLSRLLLHITLYLLHISAAYLLNTSKPLLNLRHLSTTGSASSNLSTIARVSCSNSHRNWSVRMDLGTSSSLLPTSSSFLPTSGSASSSSKTFGMASNSPSMCGFSLTRLGFVLLVVHYFVELIFHVCRIFFLIDEDYQRGFDVWAVLFVLGRLMTLTMSVLTIGFGLARSDNRRLDIATGNFNTLPIRVCCLTVVCLGQAWMMWKFINFQLRRWREYILWHANKKKQLAPRPKRELGCENGSPRIGGAIVNGKRGKSL
uniref:translocating chain-associated membrane protein 1-like isoform X1 n=1 Tax=Myxine glutinosa TaxID=7769 RepID=UPI00358E4F6A